MNWMRQLSIVLSSAMCLCLGLIPGVLHGDEAKQTPATPAERQAPANDFKGMQEREEVYEFNQKPKAVKQGEKWIITFESKGKCDATVSILDKDGKVIRHLASGVLGKNAPWPFQQDTLAQKIEWDGLKDDFSKADAANCRVRVSLGLKAKFERQMAYDPYLLGGFGLVEGTGADGSTYLLDTLKYQGRVYKDGKYVRTFWPPSAADIEKAAPLGYKMGTTKWGDKVPVSGWTGPFVYLGDERNQTATELARAMFALAGIEKFKKSTRPKELPESKVTDKLADTVFAHYSRLAVDAERDELYTSGLRGTVRFSGKTGEVDPSFKQQPWTEVAFGPDGLIYGRFGQNGDGRFLIRTDPSGKMVPFSENTLKEPAAKDLHKDGFGGPQPGVVPGVLLLGSTGTGNVYQNGLQVLATGQIVAESHWGIITDDFSNPIAVRMALADSNRAAVASKKLGIKLMGDGRQDGEQDYYVMLWDKTGKRITQNAVEGRGVGDGVYMDRDGNIYMIQGGVRPFGEDKPDKGKIDGLTDVGINYRRWGGAGCLFKFRGQGGKYPVGKFYGKIPYGDNGTPPPAEAMKLSDRSVTGALWTYDGITGQSASDCNCRHSRFYLDAYARSWIPSAQLCSITLLDTNGNRVARVGRYGNVDDTTSDLKAGKDGLRFGWVRSVCVSDDSLYAVDYLNRRIVKATIEYFASNIIPLQ